MTILDTLRLCFDRKVLLIALCLLPAAVLGGFVDSAPIMPFLFIAVTAAVGFYAVDMHRFRAYSLSRTRAKKIRLGFAAFLALALCAAYLPGFLATRVNTLLFVAPGALLGLVIQLFRKPEERWEPHQFTFTSHTTRGMSFDIVWRTMLLWMLLMPMIVAVVLAMGSTQSLYSSIGGGVGAMLGAGVTVLKTQLTVWTTFGGSAKRLYKGQLLSTGAIALSLILALLSGRLVQVGHISLPDLLAATAMGLAFQLSLMLGAYRKTNFLGAILAFLLVMLAMPLSGYLEWAPTSWQSLSAFAGVVALWLVVVVMYVPRRIATRKFGSTGLREMLGTSDKISM